MFSIVWDVCSILKSNCIALRGDNPSEAIQVFVIFSDLLWILLSKQVCIPRLYETFGILGIHGDTSLFPGMSELFQSYWRFLETVAFSAGLHRRSQEFWDLPSMTRAHCIFPRKIQGQKLMYDKGALVQRNIFIVCCGGVKIMYALTAPPYHSKKRPPPPLKIVC